MPLIVSEGVQRGCLNHRDLLGILGCRRGVVLTVNPEVAGSSPGDLAIKFSRRNGGYVTVIDRMGGLLGGVVGFLVALAFILAGNLLGTLIHK